VCSIGHPDEIPALEAELRARPDSVDTRLRLLEAHAADAQLLGSARRIELIQWLVRNRPEDLACRTPFCAVDPSRAPEGFQTVKAAWAGAIANAPENVAILRGAAAFLCAEDYGAAKDLLQRAVQLAPQDPNAWLDLGRLCREPEERLRALVRARDLGSDSPNLLSWMAFAAIEAGDLDAAESFGHELLERVEARRPKVGDALHWRERGAQLWKRARDVAGSDPGAHELVHAISGSSHDVHTGNTALGLVACRRGARDEALGHLVASFDMTPDFRLSAYGPEPSLLRELCRAGRCVAVLAVLKNHEDLWEGEVTVRWRRWIERVERGEPPD